MADHDCIQREDISSLKTSMDRINREMFNRDGIIKQVPVLSHQILELTEVIIPDMTFYSECTVCTWKSN